MKLPCTKYIGHMAVFYVPTNKLDLVLKDGQTTRNILHEFCVKNFNAYTHEVSKIQGYWMNQDILVKDEHERYEISFKGRKKVKKFVAFLSELCKLIEEDSIYLTMGYKSWLIIPKPEKGLQKTKVLVE